MPSASESEPPLWGVEYNHGPLAGCSGASSRTGKKKMRQLGTVQIPTEAFLAVLKLDE